MNEALIVAFVAIVLAIVLRTALPYFAKAKKEEVDFDWKFLGTAILTLITGAVPIALAELDSIVLMENTPLYMVFLSAFFTTLGMNELLNRFLTTWRKLKE